MLLAMAVYDTPHNNRTWMTEQTLESLERTVDLELHRLIISDNGSCPETHGLYQEYAYCISRVIYNGENIGTAKAINRAWMLRKPGEHALKMDNDVVIRQAHWVEWMEDVFDRDPSIGICGLKRRDLAESPWADGQFKSEIKMLPHEKGQRWLTVELVENVMGTCQAFNSLLLDKIGYLNQPGLYGFDDSLASVRAKVSGFKRCFLVGFEIDHIDPGGSPHGKWKIAQANKDFDDYKMLASEYGMGVRGVYCGPD